MTPCEEMGYKVGDEFTVLESAEGFTAGQTIELNRDDGTDMPMFKGRNTLYTLADAWTASGAYLDLGYVQKIKQ